MRGDRGGGVVLATAVSLLVIATIIPVAKGGVAEPGTQLPVAAAVEVEMVRLRAGS